MDLVIGATGFVGSHVLYRLVKQNRPVRALLRNKKRIENVRNIFGYYHENPSELIDSIEWFQGDVTDYHSIMESVRGISHVYHAAGLVSFQRNSRKLMDQVNHTGTANVVNACLEHKVNKLCYVSSIATLGDAVDEELIHENLLWKPGSKVSSYALTKYKGEMEVWRGINEGLDAIIVNPSLIIGPGMWRTAGAPLFTKVYNGLRFYPKGSCGYVDVRDTARIMIQLVDNKYSGERFILNSENLKHRDFINLVADALAKKRPTFLVPPLLGRIVTLVEKMKSLLTGIPPRITAKALKIANEHSAYSNKKIIDAIGNTFTPIVDSVNYAAGFFLKEH